MMVLDVQAILARLAEGDPALILPALAAAVVLLTAAGVAELFARDDLIEARRAIGVSRRSPAAPACRCGAQARRRRWVAYHPALTDCERRPRALDSKLTQAR